MNTNLVQCITDLQNTIWDLQTITLALTKRIAQLERYNADVVENRLYNLECFGLEARVIELESCATLLENQELDEMR